MKEFLSQRGIAYVEKDVGKDDEAYQELLKLGSQSVPTVAIDGKVVIGFNPEEIERLLQEVIQTP